MGTYSKLDVKYADNTTNTYKEDPSLQLPEDIKVSDTSVDRE